MNNGKMRQRAVLIVAGAALLLLSACNTVKGVGRDIESAGEAGARVMK